MHDAAHQYEADTVVLDLDDDTPIAIGRVSTEDLVAHVLVLGQRHRRTPDLKETACGMPIHSQFYPPLREQLTLLDGGLCSGCFTGHELTRAAENDEKARESDAKKAEEDQRKSTEFFASLRRKRPTTQGDR